MFRLVFIITVLECLIIPPSKANSDNMVEGGAIHFYGAVVGTSCSVDTQSLQQTIMLDQVTANTFSGPGSWASAKPFWIKLEQCDANTNQFASVMFTGQADESDPQVFKAGYGGDSARGVGIGIFDESGELVVPNTTPNMKSAVTAGQNIIFYTAKYRATSAHVEPGKTSATINFAIIYQ